MILKYKIFLREIQEEEGGGWIAEVDELGKFHILGDGETPREAFENLLKIAKKNISKNVEIKNSNLIVIIDEPN